MTVLDYARKNDFEDVIKAKPYKNKQCWAVIYRKPKSEFDSYYIGFPKYIIKENGSFRFLTYEEAMEHVSSEDE